LLPAGMEITPYNHHRRLLSSQRLRPQTKTTGFRIEPSLLSNQPLVSPSFGETRVGILTLRPARHQNWNLRRHRERPRIPSATSTPCHPEAAESPAKRTTPNEGPVQLAGSATFPNNFTLEAEGTPLLASLARKPALSEAEGVGIFDSASSATPEGGSSGAQRTSPHSVRGLNPLSS
jgi:hypothetical protein